MASHHHHAHNPFPTASVAAATTITTTTAPYGCSFHSNHCCSQPPQPLQQLSMDPLLQALSFLLQQQQQQPLPNDCTCFTKHHSHKNDHRNFHCQPQKLHFEQLVQDHQSNSVISSLLQRIDSLESSLHRILTSSASNKNFNPSYSLREAAARIIQTHFRAFLVRRSRTLSQLQDLAFIKSRSNSLKSSISSKTHFNYGLVSQKAMDLLLKLDSIQGGDPMIRDGKRSVSRDIVRFMEFIDSFAAKRHGSLYNPVKNLRLVRNRNTSRAFNSSSSGYGGLSGTQKEIGEGLRDRVENILGFSNVCDDHEEDVELEGLQQFIDDHDDDGDENHKISNNAKPSISKMRNGALVKNIGGEPRVKKTVSFAEDGNVYRIFSELQESVSKGDNSFADGSNSSGDHGENVDCIEIEKIKGINKVAQDDEVAQDDSTTSSQSSDDGERNLTRNLRGENFQRIRYGQVQGGNLVFSAPVPVKMESRADLMKKRKPVKIVP